MNAYKEPTFNTFPDEMNFFLLNNNFNRINNKYNDDDDNDDSTNFAQTRNNDEEEERERDRQKDKFQFDLPNKDYVDFETVMQNSAQNKLRDDKSNLNRRRKVSENFDDDQDDEIESDDEGSEENDDQKNEKLKRKTSVITQFPSVNIVSSIEKEDDQIGKQKQQQLRRQEYRKGRKLLEKRHKINDEGNFLFACSLLLVSIFSIID